MARQFWDEDFRRRTLIDMLQLNFNEYKIELSNESDYTPDSTDISFVFDKIFIDEESKIYQSTKHGIKILKDEKILSNALICAVGGATGIYENSAVIVDNSILICCANKVFSLNLPDLDLNWLKEVDSATCFSIFNTKNGIFIHGEMEVSKIDKSGNIIWSQGFADILVTLDGKESFILHDDFIEIEDWNHDKYKLDFNGKFI